MIEIVDLNLGYFSIAELAVADKEEIRHVAQSTLHSEAEEDFPMAMANRAGALEHVRDLVNLISTLP